MLPLSCDAILDPETGTQSGDRDSDAAVLLQVLTFIENLTGGCPEGVISGSLLREDEGDCDADTLPIASEPSEEEKDAAAVPSRRKGLSSPQSPLAAPERPVHLSRSRPSDLPRPAAHEGATGPSLSAQEAKHEHSTGSVVIVAPAPEGLRPVCPRLSTSSTGAGARSDRDVAIGAALQRRSQRPEYPGCHENASIALPAEVSGPARNVACAANCERSNVSKR
jgi:hypothetical protein